MAFRQILLNSRSYKFCCSASRGPPNWGVACSLKWGCRSVSHKTSHHHQTQQTILLHNSISAHTGSASYEAFLKTCCTTAVPMALHLCNYSWAQTKQTCLTVCAAMGHLSMLRFKNTPSFTCWQLLHGPKHCAQTEYYFYLTLLISLHGWGKDPLSRSLT